MRRLGATGALLLIVGLLLSIFTLPVSAEGGDKWFVCKYTTTPEGDEVLQTGQNPISVSESAIPVSPVFVGASFSDAQGRSLVIEQDIGQAEPAAECPETLPSPTPSPSPSQSASPPPSLSAPPSPSESPSTAPSPPATPSIPPVATLFDVEVCPLAATASTDFFAGITALDIPEGQSAIRFSARRALLLITLLNVRVDDQLVTLENTLGDGTVGDLIVDPGVHSWSISNPDDTAVLASGVVNCPVCNPIAVGPPPAVNPEVPNTAVPVVQGVGFMAGLSLMALGLLFVFNARSARRRRR